MGHTRMMGMKNHPQNFDLTEQLVGGVVITEIREGMRFDLNLLSLRYLFNICVDMVVILCRLLVLQDSAELSSPFRSCKQK